MEKRKIASLDVSVVGLGCNNFGMGMDQPGVDAVVAAAVDAGVTYFDTAESYGDGESEQRLAKALGSRRDEVIVASKWGHTNSLEEGERGGDPVQIRRRLERSLKNLGTDRIDHYQLHRPDPDTPLAETLGCLAELQAEGKIVEYGCTHHDADELRASFAVEGFAGYPSIQNHYSVLTRTPETDGVLDACAELGVVFVPYFPLESGLLTGKYTAVDDRPEGSRLARWAPRVTESFIDEEKLATVRRLEAYAADHGHTILELAMSWLASNPLVASVIAGATKPEQIRSNAAAAGWQMTEAERAEVAALAAG